MPWCQKSIHNDVPFWQVIQMQDEFNYVNWELFNLYFSYLTSMEDFLVNYLCAYLLKNIHLYIFHVSHLLFRCPEPNLLSWHPGHRGKIWIVKSTFGLKSAERSNWSQKANFYLTDGYSYSLVPEIQPKYIYFLYRVLIVMKFY